MSRSARCRSDSRIYHIMLRGINRQDIFHDEKDCLRLLETIRKYKDVSRVDIFAYCIMNNHIHMLLRESEESVSGFVKRISSSYVFWYNKRYARCGHLFQERFKSEAVDDEEYFLTVLRYIHQNPVKAEIVKNACDYKWSSYNEYLGKANITDVDFGLDILSKDRKKAVEVFQEFTNQRNNDMCLEEPETQTISDDYLLTCLSNMEISDAQELRKLNKKKRAEIIRRLKMIEGVSLRQISRLTGISKSTVDRI